MHYYDDHGDGLQRHLENAEQFNKLAGVYRGKVMKICDGNKLALVKVMVYGVHENFDNVDELPDAYVSQPFGGGSQYGTLIIPPVGSTVWIMFECGNPRAPIVIGTWYGQISENEPETPKPLQNNFIQHTQTPASTTIIEEQAADEKNIYDSQDALQQSYRNEPRCYFFKSFKGHLIEIDDTGVSDPGQADENQSTEKNHGIRITTKNKNLIHIIDEAGKEAILIKDRNGDHIQIDVDDKNINIRTRNDLNQEIEHNKNVHVINDQNERIDNDKNIHIKHDKNEIIDNNQNITVGQDINSIVGNNVTEGIGNNWVVTVQGGIAITSTGNAVVNSTGVITLVASQIHLN